MIGEEEAQREQETSKQREQASRAKFKAHVREQLAAGARKLALVVVGAALTCLVVANSERIQQFFNQTTQKLSAQVNAHSTLKQTALQYQNDVDQIAK